MTSIVKNGASINYKEKERKTMSIENHKRIYLCCQKHKKPFFKQKIKENSLPHIRIVDDMRESDMVLCIGNYITNKDMREEMLRAEQYGISTSYINENLLSDSLLNDILENNLTDDQSDYRREYESDYEL